MLGLVAVARRGPHVAFRHSLLWSTPLGIERCPTFAGTGLKRD